MPITMVLFNKTMFMMSVLVMIVCVVLAQNPVKYLFSRYNPRVEIFTASHNVEHFESTVADTVFSKYINNTNCSLYRGTMSAGDNLIVWFQGGAFLRTDRRSTFGTINDLSKTMPTFDIVTFDYPVRFKHTITDALECTYRVIDVVRRTNNNIDAYTNMHAICSSAGVLLAGAFQQNETYDRANKKIGIPRSGIPFRSITSFCGLLSKSFGNYYLDKLFRLSIMRGTAGIEYYTCNDLPKTPKFIVSTVDDYLLFQTIEYIDTEPCTSHIYRSTNLLHTFALMPHLSETQDLIKKVSSFITVNSKTEKVSA